MNTFANHSKTRSWRRIISILVLAGVLAGLMRLFFIRPNPVYADSFFSLNEGYGTSVNDTSGAVSAGTVSGAVWRTDDLCLNEKCLYFDGIQDYVSFSDDPDLDFGVGNSFTISAWIRHAPKTSGTDVIVSKLLDSDTDGGYRIKMESDGDITCEIEDADGDATIDDSATSTAATYDDNQWHFITCVKNGSTDLTLYIDGLFVAQDASLDAAATLANNETFYIGIDADGTSNDYLGFIDEVKIVRSGRTAIEVAADYLEASPASPGSGPVGYWKLDEAGDATRVDVSGNGNNLTESASDTVAQATGRYDSAADFERGDTEYLEVSDANQSGLDLTQTFTFSAWLNIESIAGATEGIMGKAGGGQISYAWGTQTLNAIVLWLDDDGFAGGDVEIATASNFVTTATWTHIAITYDGQFIRIYKNGVEQLSGSFPFATTTSLHNSSSAFRLGQWESQSTYYDGLLDEAKVYNYARTPIQVLEDMLSDPPTGAAASFGPDESYLSDGLVGYWKMDEEGDATRVDYSGNGNDLVESASDTVAQATGKFGHAGDFEAGDTEYLEISDTTSLSAGNIDMTLTAWVKAESIGDNLIIWKGGIPNSTREYHIRTDGTSDWRFGWNPGGDVASTEVANTTTSTTGVWYFITAYHKASNGEIGLSINGGPFATGTVVGGNDSTGSFRIGADQNGAENWDGLIDEVRIYKKLLSSSDIAKLYAWGSGPVGHWKFDDNTGQTAADSSTVGNAGTLGGSGAAASDDPAWVPGKLGSAMDFDGSNDFVEVISYAGIELDSSFTLSTWFNADAWPGSGNWDDVVAKDNGGNDGYFLELNDTDDLNCGFHDGVAYRDHEPSTFNGSAGTWYHVSCVFDDSADTFSVYINGVQIYTAQETSVPATGTNFLRIGQVEVAGQYFDGRIDDIKIYNYPRSASQVVQDMNGGHPAPGSPVGSAVAYWKFDEGYGTTVYDANQSTGGSEDLTLSSATSAWSSSGKFSKAFYANGARWATRSDDDDLDFTASEDITISFWMNSSIASAGNPSATEYILNKPPSGASNGGYAVYVNTSGQVCFGIDDDNSSFPEDSVCTTSDVYDNTWHNIIAVKTGTSRLDMYLDGRPNGTPDTSLSSTANTLTNTSTLIIASEDATDDGDDYTGYLDEMKMYRSALDADQIKVEYSRGSQAVMGALSTDSSGVASNSDTDSYCPPGQGSGCTAPIAHWKLDENTGTATNDTSGNANNSTTWSGTNTWMPGKFGQALNFNNNDGSVRFAETATTTDLGAVGTSYTVSAWVKNSDVTSATDGIVAKHGANTGATPFRVALTSSAKTPTFVISDGTTTTSFSGSKNITDGQWHHIVCVRNVDTDTLYIYVDGVLEASTTDTTNPALSLANNDDISIGNSRASYTTDDFNGEIDEVRIYPYARTATQVAWDYNRGAPFTWWKFDENTGTTANDSSILNNSLTLSASSWSSGKFNSALNGDGATWASRTNDADFNFLSGMDFSIAMWVKSDSAANPSTAERLLNRQSGSNAGYRLSFNTSGQLVCEIDDDTTSFPEDTAQSTTDYYDGSWHHVLCMRDITGDDLDLYVDGQFADDDGNLDATGAISNSNTLYIGDLNGVNDGDEFNGDIDDVRILKYLPTLAQIKLMIASGAVRFGPASGSP